MTISLRPRQELFVERALAELERSRYTLGVAPTGFGKTRSLTAILDTRLKTLEPSLGRPARALVVQHRDQLVKQNRATFVELVPDISTSVIDADRKDPTGQVVYAMVQSCGAKTLPILPAFDLIATDETHHSAARTYLDLYGHCRDLNPNAEFLGVTATSARGDRKSLAPIYKTVFDIVTLTETIKAGHLVPPVAKVIDLGVRSELAELRKLGDGEQAGVETILNSEIKTETVIRKWRGEAGDRSTVIFCSTVKHAEDVAAAYREAGISAACVEGRMDNKKVVEPILRRFHAGEIQVITNVMKLTEGWDCGRVGCVIFLRVCSQHSTMTQAIGRGLRLADPIEFPGVRKTDCIVLDFGISLLTHGTLEQEVSLDTSKRKPRIKTCPKCDSEGPAGASVCGICGHRFKLPPHPSDTDPMILAELSDFDMTVVEIVESSPFKWESFWGGSMSMSGSFEAWACVLQRADGTWTAVGGSKTDGARALECGAEYAEAFTAADEWMRLRAKRSEAGKAKEWLRLPATEKQLERLDVKDPSMSRYRAMVALHFKFNERLIKKAASSTTPTKPGHTSAFGGQSSGVHLPTQS